jgi:hypothetical protein
VTSTLEGRIMTIRHEPQTLVTPTLARKWLGQNAENNRKPRPSRITQYARDMHNGRWQDTGESIKFDTTGRLVDGQNRLHAVIEASEMKCSTACAHGPDGPPVMFLNVTYEVEPEAIFVMDTGAARTFGNALQFTGVHHTNNVAAVVRWAMLWDRGQLTATGEGPTHAEMMEHYHADPDRFDTAAARGRDMLRAGLGAPGPFSVAFYLFHRIDAGQAHTFFDRLITGENVSKGHPALTLRNRLIRDKGRLSRQMILALCIRGWNAFREDRLLPNIVAVNASKLTNQNFPRPR